MDVLNWIQANPAETAALLGAAYTLLCAVVRLTPTRRDDEALSAARAFFMRVSVLAPKGYRGLFGPITLPGELPKRDPLESRK